MPRGSFALSWDDCQRVISSFSRLSDRSVKNLNFSPFVIGDNESAFLDVSRHLVRCREPFLTGWVVLLVRLFNHNRTKLSVMSNPENDSYKSC